MAIDPQEIEAIVRKVVNNLKPEEKSGRGDWGVFASMDDAIAAAEKAQEEYAKLSIQQREEIIKAMRAKLKEHVSELAELAIKETSLGRVEDKKAKIELAINKTPGTEDLKTGAFSGQDGLTVTEMAPFGVICSITPSTNPPSTIVSNGIGMVAAGNGVIFNPHPVAKEVSQRTLQYLNQAIVDAGGPANLLTAVKDPTLQTVEACMKDSRVDMIVATGGGAVVNAALNSGKKAIGAAAGNPPVVVDKTADIKQAARYIVDGASFDNNVLCTAEKAIIVEEEVADELISEMTAYKGQLIEDVRAIENTVLTDDGKINPKMIGRNADHILEAAGIKAKAGVRMAIIDVDCNHPLVMKEQLMPVIPLVRVKDFAEAIEMAITVEKGNRHTAMIHSTNINNMSDLAKKIKTTIFIKNAPSYAGLGVGGEGFATLTIAGPTGEGLTSARTFTRQRRCVLVDAFSII